MSHYIILVRLFPRLYSLWLIIPSYSLPQLRGWGSEHCHDCHFEEVSFKHQCSPTCDNVIIATQYLILGETEKNRHIGLFQALQWTWMSSLYLSTGTSDDDAYGIIRCFIALALNLSALYHGRFYIILDRVVNNKDMLFHNNFQSWSFFKIR